MRVLITWGSKRGGTRGLAEQLGKALGEAGFEVEMKPVSALRQWTGEGVDAVIVGGALYANRWHDDARRFVRRHEARLRERPVWFFSSGPLDDSADRENLAPTSQVAALMERVGALGHMTFGGYLAPDARGFPAQAMARENAGDWRNPAAVQAWARHLAAILPTARPGQPIAQPAYGWLRLARHAMAGWLVCAGLMALLLAASSEGVAIAAHAAAAPVVFAAVAIHYFRPRGARDPLPAAIAFTFITAALDLLIVAGMIQRSLGMFASVLGTWLPLALVFLVTLSIGFLMSTRPWHAPPGRALHENA